MTSFELPWIADPRNGGQGNSKKVIPKSIKHYELTSHKFYNLGPALFTQLSATKCHLYAISKLRSFRPLQWEEQESIANGH